MSSTVVAGSIQLVEAPLPSIPHLFAATDILARLLAGGAWMGAQAPILVSHHAFQTAASYIVVDQELFSGSGGWNLSLLHHPGALVISVSYHKLKTISYGIGRHPFVQSPASWFLPH